MSRVCQACDARYIVHISVPDKVWEKIKPKGSGLLCGRCIVDKLEEVPGPGTWSLKRI